jgi:uncharacterized HAD superfamily protein
MIIFDLDGTLANCEHRRHFVDTSKNPDVEHGIPPDAKMTPYMILRDYHKSTGKLWKPDWKAFYEACDKDTVIEPTKKVMRSLDFEHQDGPQARRIEIWSGRCASVRQKTEKWLSDNNIYYEALKMRPIGDNTPDDVLKEKWLDEAIKEGKKIEFVFDDRTKVLRMWQRRGIFVFNVNQTGEEF